MAPPCETGETSGGTGGDSQDSTLNRVPVRRVFDRYGYTGSLMTERAVGMDASPIIAGQSTRTLDEHPTISDFEEGTLRSNDR